MPFDWTCRFCNRPTTVTDGDYRIDTHDVKIKNADGPRRATTVFVVCPNTKCKKLSFTVTLAPLIEGRDDIRNVTWEEGDILHRWSLIPESDCKPFPDYVPRAILADYTEACLIQDKSPKASATLSRRCLQGIIRDFWKVKPGRLVDEIAQIEDKIDPLTWQAIDSVRKIGNIGAHMEADVNLVIDVEPHEADLLITLIETVLQDWYVSREEKKKRLTAITAIAAEKHDQKKGAKA